MEQFIINCVKSVGCGYVKITNESDLLAIYDLFKNNKVGDNYSSMICFYYGFYYFKIKEYDLMKKYYLMAIEYNDDKAMCELGYYYYRIENNYNLAKKYLLMAIKYNNCSAMYALGHYYDSVEKDFDSMKKYYLMAIEYKHRYAMNNLARYYYQKKDYDLMEKYFLMSIEHNTPIAMFNLGHYYHVVKGNYDLMKKYYFMAVKHGHKDAVEDCLEIYKTTTQNTINDAIYFYNIANKLTEKHDAIMLACNNNYVIDKYHITDYMQSMKISMLLSKYNNICVTIKQVFMNYKQIMMCLWIINDKSFDLPKHIKLNIITLLVT